MLGKFLARCRTKSKVEEPTSSNPRVNEVVDTVLGKIFAEDEMTSDLYTLLRESNAVLVSELEPVLTRTGQYNALCMIYKERQEDHKLLEAWSKCVLRCSRCNR